MSCNHIIFASFEHPRISTLTHLIHLPPASHPGGVVAPSLIAGGPRHHFHRYGASLCIKVVSKYTKTRKNIRLGILFLSLMIRFVQPGGGEWISHKI